MAKKKNRGEDEKKEKESRSSRLHPDTKKSVLAIVFLGLAAVLFLSSAGNAGPLGGALYQGLEVLFGLGFYIVPSVLILIALAFLFSHEEKFIGITLSGATIFILAGLATLDIIFPEKAGWTGKLLGAVEVPFGYTAALVITITVMCAAVLVTLNASIKLNWLRDIFKTKEGTEKKTEIEPIVASPAMPESPLSEAEKKLEEKTDEEKEMEPEPGFLFAPSQKARPLKQRVGKYTFPLLSLLNSGIDKPTSGDLRANANIIKRTLESFGIPVEMGEINIGPKVTRYTLKPAEGVKISKILTLNQDLALALAAHPIRIEAPIPGKSLVGIEVPNKSAAIVRLGSLMSYNEFQESGPLTFVVGRNVNGDPIFADIDRMPHLLVAGATGSGKSVTIHSLIVSLLYKNTPDMLRFVLIDPKRVELSIYEGIPHLVAPVITEAKKTLGVFRWAIAEMDRRYETLLRYGARDIQSYNKKSADGKLPYIVVVVDELADLMAQYGREVEGSIVRIAQMARATGIHLVVSTQRPSVEVITGLIKANITSRIALQVASQVDSRTILDAAGAEKLLGGGDMLFISSEFSKPRRIQGAYITEDEIHAVADFIREHNAEYEPEELPLQFAKNGDGNGNGMISLEQLEQYEDDEEDPLYDEAMHVVREAQKASASLLQRRLKVGYARAARLLDIMEARGVVGPGEGAKPREVYGEPPQEVE